MDMDNLVIIKSISKSPNFQQIVLESIKSQMTQLQDLLLDLDDEGRIPVVFDINKTVYADKIFRIEENLKNIRMNALAQ